MNTRKLSTLGGPDPDKQDPAPDEVPNPGDPGPEIPRPPEPVDPFVNGAIPPQNSTTRGV